MIISKFKKKNLIEVDEQTMFILKVVTNANNENFKSFWRNVKEGDIVRQLVDDNLLPKTDVLYDHVMQLVSEAMDYGERPDYRDTMTELFKHASHSMNLSHWDIKEISKHMNPKVKIDENVSLEFFKEFNHQMSAADIAEKMSAEWKTYQNHPEAYMLMDELLRINYPENPVSLYNVLEWYTIVTIRPLENESARDA